MSLGALMVLYGLAGLGCAAARMVWRSPGRLADALLLVLLWPLYGPFLLARLGPGESRVADSEVAFLAALRRAGQSPLGGLLPDESTVRALGARLRLAARKVEEIDALLLRPEFAEKDARQRIGALQGRSASACAISTATMRLHNILRLRALRDRFAVELDEVGELLLQLCTQAEVVRLAGVPADAGLPGSVGELLSELVSRIEGLDQVLDDDPHLADA